MRILILIQLINIILKTIYNSDIKSEYNNKLKKYYYDNEAQKRNIWQTQINNSKYKTAVQSWGENECINDINFLI